jgi:phosphatidate cytidylyltransferase
MVRIATAVVLAPALWALIQLAPGNVFFAVGLVVIGIAAWECCRIVGATGARPFSWIGVVGAVAVAASFVGLYELALPLTIASLATISLTMLCRDDPKQMLLVAAKTLFPILFVGLSFGFLIGIRSFPGEDGRDLLLLLFSCIILADTGAYYVGRAFGRHLMAPVLSPKKTWEGAFGGVVASVLGAILAHVWFYQRLPLVHAITLGAILGVTSIVGDLSESMVKRSGDVKDSSGLLPGHGGVLDRTDSLIFSGPILYYYYRFVLTGVS